MMMKAEESPYRVMVTGKTGSGKSSVLNSLTRTEHFHVGDSIMSETKDVQAHRCKFKGRLTSPDIVFLDTPGFFDSSSRDNRVIAKIALSLHKIEDGLNLVLFCFPAYEIRLDSSMQASWRFLQLVMGKAVYEHVVIVLTHGNRLTSQELENAVRRMTTEFIPYLRNNLKCKVKEEILIYHKGEADDGLEDVLKYITSSSKYQPQVMEDLGRFWKPDDPLGSIEYLLQNSQIFNKIQELLFEVRDKNENIQDQLAQIKHEMDSIGHEQSRQVKDGLHAIEHSAVEKIQEEKREVSSFKDEVGHQMRLIQRQLEEKDKQIAGLRKGIDEVRSSSNHSTQPSLNTTRYPDHNDELMESEERKKLMQFLGEPVPHLKHSPIVSAQPKSQTPATAKPQHRKMPAAGGKPPVMRSAARPASQKQPIRTAAKIYQQQMPAARRAEHGHGSTPKMYLRPGLEYGMPK